MENARKISLKRLLCVLLSAFIILGFVPFTALSVHAEDDPNTIGELDDGTARYGNGWAWDGSGNLTLYGAKIDAGAENVFTYSGNLSIAIELIGYNEVSSDAAFADIDNNIVFISGSGILKMNCPFGTTVTMNSGYIESTAANLVGFGNSLNMNGGYISAPNAAAGTIFMYKGYLDIGSITGNANVEGGYLKAGSVTANSTMSIQNCVVDIAGGVDGTVTFEESNCVFIYDNSRSSTASIVNTKYGNDVLSLHTDLRADGRSVYCYSYKESSNNTVVTLGESACGLYCKGSIEIDENGSFSGGVYIDAPSGSSNYALSASDTGGYNAITTTNATIVTSGGKGISLDDATFGANNTVVAANGINLLNGSLTGTSSVLVAEDASVEVKGLSEVEDGAYIFSNCSDDLFLSLTLDETANMTILNKTSNVSIDGAIDGSLTSYSSESGSVNSAALLRLGSYSKIAAYSKVGCNIFSSSDWYIPTHTFYYADDIGSEFKTTTDTCLKAHTAKAVYYGKELQPRLDDDKYVDDNGNTVSSTTTLSAAAEDSAQFVISSSGRIPTPETELTASLITPYGQTSEDVEFNLENVNNHDKRILVTMTLNRAVIPGDYTVRIQKNKDVMCEFPITLTSAGDTPMMDFTAGAGAWTYKNSEDETTNFTGKDTDVTDAATWRWYGTADNKAGYDKYTLVLCGFNGMCDHPIKLPAGSTIILKENNTLTTQGNGILCDGGDLTITRDDDMSGYLILKAGENGDDTSAIKVTGGDLTIDGVTVDISVDGSTYENYAVYAESEFIIHEAIVTLKNLNTTSGSAACATAMHLSGTSTLIAQAQDCVFDGNTFLSARATKVDNVSCFSCPDISIKDYNEQCEKGYYCGQGPVICTDETRPLTIMTQRFDVADTTVHLPVVVGKETTWNILNDYLTINGGSGCFILSGALNEFKKNTSGVTSIALSDGTITAEFTEDFVGGKDNAITLYLNEYVLGSDDVPITVIFDRYYTVDVNSTGSGSVTLANGYTSDQVVSGGSIAFDIIPADGNKITKIIYKDKDFTDQFDKYVGGTLTLANITSDGTLNVAFEPLETFKLDVECDNFDNLYYDVNGTFNQPDGYTEGTELTVSFVPEPDWTITSVRLNGTKLTLAADNKYTFTITENSTLAVEMENLIKTVTVNKTGEGTATSSADTVRKGGSVDFTITPAKGWRIGSAKLSGEDVKSQIDANGKLTVSNVTEDLTLDVVFVEMSKCVLDVTIPHGSFTADPAGLSYEAGTQVTVTLMNDGDWAITAVKLNGTALALTTNHKYTFTITEDSKLDVEMENLIKSVTVNKTGEGTATSSADTVIKGGSVYFTITPANGWSIKSVTLNGADVKSQINASGKLTVNNVTTDIMLNVVFEQASLFYTLTVPQISHGNYAVTPAGPVYKAGSQVTVTVFTESNWAVKSVLLNGTEIALTNDNKYTFTINENTTFAVETENLLKTVTVVCGAGGSVDPASAQVLKGTQATFNITPYAGYRIASVKLDGVTQTVISETYSFIVTNDCVLSVEFVKNGSYEPSRPNIPTQTQPSQTLPSINGSSMSWIEIIGQLNALRGDSVIISMNGLTSIPADVIKAIANYKNKVEFVIDNTMSWIIDGEKISTVSSANLTVLPGNINASALRGTIGSNLTINGTGVPVDLKLTFGKDNSSKFANIYKLVNNKPVFQSCAKISDDGSALISGMSNSGKYVVMVCEFSDIVGDVNNDGVVNALDASAILKKVVKISDIDNPLVSDFNGDGTINALDASAILRYITER